MDDGPEKVDVSVVVPFRDAGADLERCIRALLRQDYPRERYELIFVDNGSIDGSAELARRHPEVTVLSEPKPGAYAARNRGAAHASGRILAFTDGDCEASPGWLSALVDGLEQDGVEVVLGVREPRGRSRLLRLLADYEHARNEYVFNSSDPGFYFGYTNSMGVRREVFLEQGGFVERRRGGDSVFVQRVLKGRTPDAVRLVPEMTVTHLELERLADPFRKFFVYGRSRRLVEPVERVRPLSLGERLVAFRRAVRANGHSPVEAAALFALLGAGALSFHAGALSARLLPVER